MKKNFYILLILLSLLLISSCGSNSEEYIPQNSTSKEEIEVPTVLPEADSEKAKYTILDFLPSKINIEFSFSRGSENEIIKEYVVFSKENKIQIKSVSSSSIASSIYEVQKDALVLTYIAEDNYIKKELFNEKSNSNEILLMNPILIGTTWTNGNKSLTITGIDIPIRTNVGTYNSIEVTTSREEFTQKDYYALGLGKIKTIIETNGTTFTTELIGYKKEEILKGKYRYYFNSTSGKELYYLEENVSELSEEELKKRIMSNLYNPPREDLVSLEDNIKINFITLSPERDYVHIDFSSKIKDEVYLKSLANTLGFNYQVENILITFDGKSFPSKQLSFEEMEQFKVDYSNYRILE